MDGYRYNPGQSGEMQRGFSEEGCKGNCGVKRETNVRLDGDWWFGGVVRERMGCARAVPAWTVRERVMACGGDWMRCVASALLPFSCLRVRSLERIVQSGGKRRDFERGRLGINGSL